MNLKQLVLIQNWLFILFPISFIAGNLILNLHLIIFILLGCVYLIKKKTKFQHNALFLTFLLFSVILIISSIFNQFNIDKSFSYLRFFAFYVIVFYLLKEKIFNLRKIFYYYAFFVSIICIDLIIQYIFGYNIFGVEINRWRGISLGATSFFFDEQVAGSFVQSFGFYLIFYIFDKFKKNNFPNLAIKSLIISSISISIFVSFQRMPMMVWIFFLSIYGIIYYRTRLINILSSFIIFFLFINIFSSERSIDIYKSFFTNSKVIVEKSLYSYRVNKDKKKLEKIKSDIKNIESFVVGSGHANLFGNALYIWQDNKLLGVGYKKFYNKCAEKKLMRCSTHPHNYYLDVLVTTGIIGLSVLLIYLIILFSKTISSLKFYYKKKYKEKINITLIILMNFIMIFFPFKSSGSFFTTSNAFYTTITLALLASQLVDRPKKFL